MDKPDPAVFRVTPWSSFGNATNLVVTEFQPSVLYLLSAPSTPESARQEAIENAAAADALPETFVDHAEEIWRMVDEGKKQQVIADEIGWSSRSQVADYVALGKISDEAWDVVAVATHSVAASISCDSSHSENVATFTEGLLRSILPLTPAQQHPL